MVKLSIPLRRGKTRHTYYHYRTTRNRKRYINRNTNKINGEKKISTTNPERHVWGDYTSLLQNAKLVHISEVTKANIYNNKNKFKGLVTDPKITIKAEGKTPFIISSYHSYITATNDNEPIEIKKEIEEILLLEHLPN